MPACQYGRLSADVGSAAQLVRWIAASLLAFASLRRFMGIYHFPSIFQQFYLLELHGGRGGQAWRDVP